MKLNTRKLTKRLERLEDASRARDRFDDYGREPIRYARQVLKADWWAKQQQIAESLLTPPYRTLVKASHAVGKSHVAAGLVNWWYDTRNPSIAITSAPTFKQIQKVLWKEIRLQRRKAKLGGFTGPKVPELWDNDDHYAIGITGERGESVQGQHGPAVLIVLDEAVGVEPYIWEAADSMCMGVEYAFLAICNPTDLTSEFYRREQQLDIPWHTISISCFEHPNIAAELRGLPPVYPSAVRLAWVHERVLEWCEPVDGEPVDGEPLPTDILWPSINGEPVYGTPLGGPRLYRPGPEAEAKLLGRWPSQVRGIWSDLLWGQCESLVATWRNDDLPVVGCDVARAPDGDDTAFHVRIGPVSLAHESINGQDVAATIGKLKLLAEQWAAWMTLQRNEPSAQPVSPKDIPIHIDDDGVGGGVTDVLRADGYRVVPLNASCRASRPDRYPNLRSEFWFAAAERAKAGQMSLARLSRKAKHKLKIEAMAPQYKLDAAGRRVVEPKEETKKPDRLGRSPDNMDALNLAYYEPTGGGVAVPVDVKPRDARPSGESAAERRGLWGGGGQ